MLKLEVGSYGFYYDDDAHFDGVTGNSGGLQDFQRCFKRRNRRIT